MSYTVIYHNEAERKEYISGAELKGHILLHDNTYQETQTSPDGSPSSQFSYGELQFIDKPVITPPSEIDLLKGAFRKATTTEEKVAIIARRLGLL